MEEQLISLETARLLKEKGCNLEKCHCGGYPECICSDKRITQSLAQKWLRDSKGILVLVVLDSKGLRYDITRNNATIECKDYHLSYEGTLEEGLKQALKII